MGQRLVVSVLDAEHRDYDAPVASIYYHWGEYTYPAYEIFCSLLTYLDEYKNIENPIVRIATGLVEHGGLVDRTDVEENLKEHPEWLDMFSKELLYHDGSRNDGILSLTEETIKDSIGWAEGLGILDLTNNTCTISSFYGYENKQEVMSSEGFTEEEFEEEVFNMPYDPVDMDLEKVKACLATLDENDRCSIMRFPSGEYGLMIQ